MTPQVVFVIGLILGELNLFDTAAESSYPYLVHFCNSQ